jgi:S-DNA-T family DNA segregation ATPase FtsK/SpoIIIE
MFGRKKTTIDPATLIESAMTYTTKPATRTVGNDKVNLNRALAAIGNVRVLIDDFVPGIKYMYYLKPYDLKDYDKLVKNVSIFQSAFGTDDIRLYKENGYVVLEVPGAPNSTVHAADMLRNDEYYRSTGLTVAIGKKMNRENVLADISKMPHMLIAGTTGSGKSIMMHQIIVSLLINHSVDDLQLYLVDPKMVEMPLYESLRNCHVVSTTDAAIELLDELCIEMDRRYEALSRGCCRDIDSYNSTARKPMSRKVVFIDELADLILTSKKKVEKSIVRLAQKARACGIHLVIATQRPDRTVVTGLIKTNIPIKVCLKVNSGIDSRIVLDRVGAEKLVGKGDMLYLGEGMIEPIRCQGGYISEQEIKNVVSALSRR